MIIITERAKKKLKKIKIKDIYIMLKYIQGPCNDNLCKMIPKIEISLTPENINYVLLCEDEFNVYSHKLLAESILKHKDNVVIDYSTLKQSFIVKGITYSF